MSVEGSRHSVMLSNIDDARDADMQHAKGLMTTNASAADCHL
eukprot:CAMPEP_0181183528 /NCGR_PEP_ID=MMETSP1096-20121128/8474_1 /TAXON_ID=156174 ORGANISM="Chrysochromulina ericina, Strain CCMP281" /NCGR_SAMPLE_ID=MMETSP1096 /ASSEMBLY_ACC=CAM_ASM_000453 /LENGTH=41 /DNA_ID= /DNA_START= /DNA_END= /DNA_ORIENTATION=